MLVTFNNQDLTDNNEYNVRGVLDLLGENTNRVTANVLNYIIGGVTGRPYVSTEIIEYPLNSWSGEFSFDTDNIMSDEFVTGLNQMNYGGDSLDTMLGDIPFKEDLIDKINDYKEYAKRISGSPIGLSEDKRYIHKASAFAFLNYLQVLGGSTSIQDVSGFTPTAFATLTLDGKKHLVSIQNFNLDEEEYDDEAINHSIKFYNFWTLKQTIDLLCDLEVDNAEFPPNKIKTSSVGNKDLPVFMGSEFVESELFNHIAIWNNLIVQGDLLVNPFDIGSYSYNEVISSVEKAYNRIGTDLNTVMSSVFGEDESQIDKKILERAKVNDRRLVGLVKMAVEDDFRI